MFKARKQNCNVCFEQNSVAGVDREVELGSSSKLSSFDDDDDDDVACVDREGARALGGSSSIILISPSFSLIFTRLVYTSLALAIRPVLQYIFYSTRVFAAFGCLAFSACQVQIRFTYLMSPWCVRMV